MPKGHPYPYELPSYGTDTTCTIQGIIYTIGNTLIFWFNGLLNLYYLLSLGFNIHERNIRFFAEIPFTVIGLIVCIGVSPLMVKDYINPGPHDPYCTLYQVPCDEEQEDCNTDGSSTFNKGYMVLLSVGFALLIGSQGYITWKFYSNKRKLKHVQEEAEREEENNAADAKDAREKEEDIETLKFAQENYKTIAIQAFLYIMAFNCVWIFGLLAFLFDEDYLNERKWLQDSLAMLRMIFQPSQGTFNMLIFVYHKILELKRDDPETTLLEGLSITIFHPDMLDDEPQIFSNFELVNEYFYNRRLQNRMIVDVASASPASGVDASVDEDVQQASLGGISNGLEISDKSPSFKGSIGSLGGFSGFSSNFKSDGSNNLGVKSSVSDPAQQKNNFSISDDNDISYAKESTLSNDSNLSFKSFFSKKKDRSS